MPPSTVRFSAVIKEASSEARKRMALDTSSASPILLRGYTAPACGPTIRVRVKVRVGVRVSDLLF